MLWSCIEGWIFHCLLQTWYFRFVLISQCISAVFKAWYFTNVLISQNIDVVFKAQIFTVLLKKQYLSIILKTLCKIHQDFGLYLQSVCGCVLQAYTWHCLAVIWSKANEGERKWISDRTEKQAKPVEWQWVYMSVVMSYCTIAYYNVNMPRPVPNCLVCCICRCLLWIFRSLSSCLSVLFMSIL